jgi:hypothetical protein
MVLRALILRNSYLLCGNLPNATFESVNQAFGEMGQDDLKKLMAF